MRTRNSRFLCGLLSLALLLALLPAPARAAEDSDADAADSESVVEDEGEDDEAADEGETAIPVESVVIREKPSDGSSIEIKNGDVKTFTAAVTPDNATDPTCVWSSSDTAVATADEKTGAVKAVGAGTAKITATAGEKSDSVTISVPGIRLEDVSVGVGKTATAAKSLYGNASSLSSDDWEWSVKDSSIARVHPITGVITGVAKGTTTVTCAYTGSDKTANYSAVCTVTVTEDAGSVIYGSLTDGKMDCSTIVGKLGSGFQYITNLSVPTGQGTLYYGYVAEGDTGEGVASSERYSLSSWSADYRYMGNITFVPKPGFSGEAVVTYTGVTSTGAQTNGEIRIPVSASAQLAYVSNDGEAIRFQADDFSLYSKSQYGLPLNYVLFELPDTKYGYLCYGYSGGVVYDSSVDPGSRYYRISSPSLDDVWFVPAEGYQGSFVLNYQGFDTSNNSYQGTVRITVGAGGGEALIRYETTSLYSVGLVSADFISACKDATGGRLSYIKFSALPSSAQGTLLYDGSSGVTTTAYYYAYGSSRPLSCVSFAPESAFTGTVQIPFTGWDSSGGTFLGTILITVEAASVKPGWIYYSSDGVAARFSSSDFVRACSSLPGTLSKVLISLPDSAQGALYLNYTTPVQSAKAPENQAYAPSMLSSVFFVPKAGFSGEVVLPYTATDARGNTCAGSISIWVSPPANSAYFSDMDGRAWAVPSVDFLTYYGILKGVNDGSAYSPGWDMQRGDFILMLTRTFVLPDAGDVSFADVPWDSYYARAIASARAAGYIYGDSTTNFYPTAPITRQAAATVLYRCLRDHGMIPAGSAKDLASFRDADQVPDYAVEAMASLVRSGILVGDQNGCLNPGAALTRAEMAVIFHRALTLG